MTDDCEDYASWIGRTETVEDEISLATAQAAAATWDEKPAELANGTELPPLWHWFYFLEKSPQAKLGSDGHPRRDDSFFPPVPYPRRMFAGARLQLHRPLVCGRPASRQAVIRNVATKTGRSGSLAFVTVGYTFHQNGELCLTEEQDIVYREPGPPWPAPQPTELPAVPNDAWSRVVAPDTRLLFRFSALTFNAHRIHYDRTYAINEEGYPGLVVHGPLIAMLLLQLARQNTSKRITAFRFRSQAPIFDLAPFRLIGIPAEERVELEAQRPDGQTAMIATAEFQN